VFSFGKKINQSNSTCDVRWETWLCFLAPSPAVRGFVLVTSLYYMKEKTKKKDGKIILLLLAVHLLIV